MENFWVASYEVPFAIWRITIPFNIDAALEFATEYEQLAEKTQIAQITFEQDTLTFKQATGLLYADYLADCVAKEQILPFMIPSSRTLSGYHTSLIQYYDKHGLVQARVSNLGDILKRLKPNATHHQQYRYMKPEPPIIIWGHTVNLRKRQKPDNLHFSIWLKSDIWFPYVLNWIEPKKREWEINYDLAEYHTPRLNQFIEGIGDLCLTFNGLISLDTSETLFYYREILSDKGINLEAPPPEN